MKIVRGDFNEIEKYSYEEKFGVIVADPPWAYKQKSARGSAATKYNTLTIEQLSLKGEYIYNELAAENCVLLLWGTWPLMPECLKVMYSWGFDFVSGCPYIKTTKNEKISWGVGHWLRGCSEYFLIGRKGKPKLPDKNFLGLIAPQIKHSRKPENIFEYAESLEGPYLELFATQMRKNWAAFGDQISFEEETSSNEKL